MRSKNAVNNIITSLVLQIIIVVYGFIVPKIIISSYGSNVNGLISSITQFLSYIALLESGFGPVITAALYRPIAKNNKNEISNILKKSESFFRTISFIFIFYIVILCFIFPILVSNNFDGIFTQSMIVIIGISIFAEYFFGMTYKLYLQANQKMYIIPIVQIITYIFSIIIILILANIGVSVHALKLASGLVFIMRPIILNNYVKKKYNITYNNIDKNFRLKQKWDGLAQHIAAVIHNNTDITILTIFTTLSEVSVYSVYYLVIKGIKSLIQSLTSGVEAIFGDMIAKKELSNLNNKFNLYENIYFTIITVVCT